MWVICMIIEPVLTVLFSVIVTALASVTSLSVKNKADNKINSDDLQAAKNAGDFSRLNLRESNKDVISLMINNVSELREYYVISKRQANRAFSSTLFVCVLGFLIFVVGIIAAAVTGRELALYTTISGCVVEVISGLFFWLYKNTTAQLNIYHERLGRTEKYLTALQITEKMSLEKQDEMYQFIIQTILDNGNPHDPQE